MAVQNYKNHLRFYPPHHFVFYPVMLILMGITGYYAYSDITNKMIWIILLLIVMIITWVAFMMRQHYALTLQNRLVLLEFRYRYHRVTGQWLEDIEDNLTQGQMFALRFAPDAELQTLAKRAVQENLKPDAIKRSINNWLPDEQRV